MKHKGVWGGGVFPKHWKKWLNANILYINIFGIPIFVSKFSIIPFYSLCILLEIARKLSQSLEIFTTIKVEFAKLITLGNKIPARSGIKECFLHSFGWTKWGSPKRWKRVSRSKKLLFNFFGTRLFVSKFYIGFQHYSLHMQWSSRDACYLSLWIKIFKAFFNT